MQLEVIDFFDTYAPVVQWNTIHSMLINEVLLQFISNQGDIAVVFLNAKPEK